MNIYLIIIFILAVWLGVLIWLLFYQQRIRAKAFQRALEANQRLVDQQTSQANIFIKSLSNIQSFMVDRAGGSQWKAICLDELRTMVKAEGASYWAYSEKEQLLERELARGVESGAEYKMIKSPLGSGMLGEACRQKSATTSGKADDLPGQPSVMVVPLFVGDNLKGVIRLIRKTNDVFVTREMNLVSVFIQQVTLALQNKEIVDNRERFYLELVQTLADTVDSRDAETEGHIRRIRKLARDIAKELDMPEEFIYYLEFAALIHDIGKIVIDANLLKKPGKLTPAEFEIIKKSPEFGYKILAPVTMLAPVAPIVLYHKEWYNGTGYPEGLKGEEIPLGARIIGLLDAWGAMTSDRPWRKALTVVQATKEVKKGSGTQFDPKVVDALLNALEKQEAGSTH